MPKKTTKKAARTTGKQKPGIKKPSGRGGARKGTGRPVGSGKYGEATKAVRLPVSLIDDVLEFVRKKVDDKKAKKNKKKTG